VSNAPRRARSLVPVLDVVCCYRNKSVRNFQLQDVIKLEAELGPSCRGFAANCPGAVGSLV